MLVRRGVQRLLSQMGAHVLPELCAGHRPACRPRGADADRATSGSSRSNRRSRIFASTANGRTTGCIPTASSSPPIPACRRKSFREECGFILSDGYGAEILRDAPEHRLAPATRKALMLRLARAGAARLLAAELAGVSVPALDGESE